MAPLKVGDTGSFTKTIGESDVYLYAGITGDIHRNHIDESYMRTTEFGHRIAHGVLLLGLASTASSQITNQPGVNSVSYGYDRVRHTAPVLLGDTVHAVETVERIDEERRMVYSDVKVTKADGTVCLVATHLIKYFD
jgi:3-hydroxybutyryl-CoA dehydratase